MYVVDSFFSDFQYCVAITGACGDAQAIDGGLGDLPMGPIRSSTTSSKLPANLLFGGGRGHQNRKTSKSSQNHLFKPLIWMKGPARFCPAAGRQPLIVKII